MRWETSITGSKRAEKPFPERGKFHTKTSFTLLRNPSLSQLDGLWLQAKNTTTKKNLDMYEILNFWS